MYNSITSILGHTNIATAISVITMNKATIMRAASSVGIGIGPIVTQSVIWFRFPTIMSSITKMAIIMRAEIIKVGGHTISQTQKSLGISPIPYVTCWFITALIWFGNTGD